MSDHFHALKNGYKVEGYEIQEVLGFGGFGLTYLAHDINLDKLVAVKEYLPADLSVRDQNNSVIPKSSGNNIDFTWGLERFLDEARLLAKFDHKNIVSVLRFFEAHGTAYIVMEYVDGETLSALMKREGILPYNKLKSIVDHILSGLEVVHEGDFLHRDIKPGNIIIRDNGTPVLIDFGAARQAVGMKSRSVRAIVTLGYSPIEQYSTRGNQGAWTDIYALGAICYRAITGKTPDDATARVRRDPLIPLVDCNIPKKLGYPDHVLKAVDMALNVDEEDRPRSIDDWRAMLEGRVEPTPVVAPASPSIDDMAKTRLLPKSTPETAIKTSSPVVSAIDRSGDGSRSKLPMKAILAGVGAIAVLGLLGTALIYMGGNNEGDATDDPIQVVETEIDPAMETAWSQAQSLNTVEGYEAFLKSYPDGPYTEEAKSSIEALKNSTAFKAVQAKDLVSSYGEYVRNYPNGIYHRPADDGAWSSAQRQHTIGAYEAYLRYFPQGQNVDEAEAAIASLRVADTQALAAERARAEAQAAAEEAAAEAAREEAARQEASRQEEARNEALRQEAVRQEEARQDAVRREEAAKAEAERLQNQIIQDPDNCDQLYELVESGQDYKFENLPDFQFRRSPNRYSTSAKLWEYPTCELSGSLNIRKITCRGVVNPDVIEPAAFSERVLARVSRCYPDSSWEETELGYFVKFLNNSVWGQVNYDEDAGRVRISIRPRETN